MLKTDVISKNAPKAIGPYSQAVMAGDYIFCSGQIAVDPKTNSLIQGNLEKQTKLIFQNISEILKRAGCNLDSVVKVNVYLKNMNDFSEMNSIYETYFKKPYPARSTIEVSNLPKGAIIEIDVIGHLKS